eukprot:Opistho-2@58518
MAPSADHSSDATIQEQRDVRKSIEGQLDGHKGAVLFIEQVLLGQKPHIFILIGVVQLAFWFLATTTWTVVSIATVFAAIAVAADYGLAIISAASVSDGDASNTRFKAICADLAAVVIRFRHFRRVMDDLRTRSPLQYMAMVGASLIAVGYLGNCISGLVLAYITAMAAIVYPAASANGLIAGVCERVSAVVSPIIDKLRIIVNRTRGIAPDAHHDVRPRKPSKAD